MSDNEEISPILPENQDEHLNDEETESQLRLKRRIAAVAILLTVTLERLAFYALVGNLYLFLNQQPLEWTSYSAMSALLVFTGSAFGIAIFTGWLGDRCGRFSIISVSLCLYTASFAVFPVLASSKSDVHDMCLWRNDTVHTAPACSWLIYPVLVIIGVCASAVKANIAPFGADQVKLLGKDSLRTFFNWYYWCTNIGAFVSIGGLAYIQQSTTNGFYLGYIIPSSCLGASSVIFLLSKPFCGKQSNENNVFNSVFGVFKEACKSNKRHRTWRRSMNETESSSIVRHSPSWLDMAKIQYGGRYAENVVDDVKKLWVILVIFALLIPYWLLYFQMQTTFQAQGLHMRLVPEVHLLGGMSPLNETLSSKNIQQFSIPTAWLTLFDVIFLLIFIPLLDRVIYPFFDRRNCRFPMQSRMLLGMVFASFSMIVAGGLETYRLNLLQSQNETVVQIIGNTTFYAADMWVFWQIPQYALIGVSEVFASVTGLEFAYLQAPISMQGVIMGLFNLSAGIGSFLGRGLLMIVHRAWLVDTDAGNINYGHLNFYFFLLAGIEAITVLIFGLIIVKCDSFKRIKHGSHRSISSAT